MNLRKRFLILFRKQLPDPDALYRLEQDLHFREQELQEMEQHIEAQAHDLRETDRGLKEMDATLRDQQIQLSEKANILKVEADNLISQKAKLTVEQGLLDIHKRDVEEKLADVTAQATRIAKEEVEIEDERASLKCRAEELSIRESNIEELKQTLQSEADSLKERNEKLSAKEKELETALLETNLKKEFYGEELAAIRRTSEEIEKHRQEIAKKAEHIDERERDVRLREEELRLELLNIETKRSELEVRERDVMELVTEIGGWEKRVRDREEALDTPKEPVIAAAEGKEVIQPSNGGSSEKNEERGDTTGTKDVEVCGEDVTDSIEAFGEGGEKGKSEGGRPHAQHNNDEKQYKKPYVKGDLREPGLTVEERHDLHHIPDKQTDEIDLGAQKRRPAPCPSSTVSLGEQAGALTLKDQSHRIETPYVQMNLDERRICLILPKQKIILDEPFSDEADSVLYKVTVNGRERRQDARLLRAGNHELETEEISISLEEAVENFRVEFPGELKGKVFRYRHSNPGIYAFVPTTDGLAKMKYLFDADNKLNPLPRRNLWLLLREDCHLNVTPDVEEGSIWERYRPVMVDKEKVPGLIVQADASVESLVLQSVNSFTVEGKGLIADDLAEENPLFTKGQLLLNPPVFDEEGWVVWLQHKEGTSKILTRNWTGLSPLSIKLPDDLQAHFGQFQLDVCDQDDRVPIDSLFFRYIPIVSLEYPRELQVPQPEGFPIIRARISFESGVTDLLTIAGENVQMNDGECLIEIPREHDTASVTISESQNLNRSCPIQITVPRVRWRVGNGKESRDTPVSIEKKDISYEEGLDLSVAFGDDHHHHAYKVEAVLDTSFRQLQRGWLSKSGPVYKLRLNTFFDTVLRTKENMWLNLRFYGSLEHVKEVGVIRFLSLFVCETCGFSCHERSEMLEHLSGLHLDNHMHKLTLEEMHEYDETLPHFIYKCGHCGFYAKEDSIENPNSQIYNHLINSCPRVDHSGPVEKIFRRVSDIDEIRQNIFPHLPDFRKCRFCNRHIETADQKEQFEHLLRLHEDELFTVT